MTSPLAFQDQPRADLAARNALMRLPRAVKERLQAIPRHVHALETALAQTDADRFVDAAIDGPADALLREVYPLERALQLLDAYVVDLAALAVHSWGIDEATPEENFRNLAVAGATTQRRAVRLIQIDQACRMLARPYDRHQARLVVEAAVALTREIVPFLREYTEYLMRAVDAPPDDADDRHGEVVPLFRI